mmetsp:Transcript_16078/g.39786  ORF Transcript_16078/g.39786 Transcript_16078/m.39786 type:complete len:476 (+) Transcript_16078:844-2271(+)
MAERLLTRRARSASRSCLALTMEARLSFSFSASASSFMRSRSRSSASDISSSSPNCGVYVGSSAFTRLRGTSSSARICLIRSLRRASSTRRSSAACASSRSVSSRTACARSLLSADSASAARAGFSRCACTSTTRPRWCATRCSRSCARFCALAAASALAAAARCWFSMNWRCLASLASSSASLVSSIRRSTSEMRCCSSRLRMRCCHASNSEASRSSLSYAPSSFASFACFCRYRLSSRRMAPVLRRTAPCPASCLGTGLAGAGLKVSSASRSFSTSSRTFSRLLGRVSERSLNGCTRGLEYCAFIRRRLASFALSMARRSTSFELSEYVEAGTLFALITVSMMSSGGGTSRIFGCVRLKGSGVVCTPPPPRPSASALAASAAASFFAASAAMFPSSTTSSFSTCGTKTSTLPMSCSSTHAGSYSLSHSGRSHFMRFSSEKRNLSSTLILKCSCPSSSALKLEKPSSCSRSSAR